jgi:hypothetical protein
MRSQRRWWFALLVLVHSAVTAAAAPKSVRVFVALCDNRTQGIQPVGERIGNGDDPLTNLYWGCADGLGSYFRRSRKWKVVESQENPTATVLRRLRLRHVDADVDLVAEAYRGSAIAVCLADFERTAGSGLHDLVAFIGHNVLMDQPVPEAARVPGNRTAAVVLCCQSERYFRPRLERLGCEPLLLTRQYMYPGSFLLHDLIEVWKRGGSAAEMRAAAGRAYARNQGISVAAGTGVFAPVDDGRRNVDDAAAPAAGPAGQRPRAR